MPPGQIGRGNNRQSIIESFHELYYSAAELGGTWKNTYWLGTPTEKCPLDLWVYQEILHEVRPDIVVETGTRWGGSALFMASVCDLLGRGRIITIDIDVPGQRPQHDRITYLHGSSISEEVVATVRSEVERASRVMVALDSDHTMEHVLAEMRAYAALVSAGSYLVVEDTNINGNPVLPGWGPGPWEAVQRFLEESDEFMIDETREKFLMTFNPKGFLRRTKHPDSSP